MSLQQIGEPRLRGGNARARDHTGSRGGQAWSGTTARLRAGKGKWLPGAPGRPVGLPLIGAFVSAGRRPRRPGPAAPPRDLLKITSSSTSSPHVTVKGREGERNRSREPPPHTGFRTDPRAPHKHLPWLPPRGAPAGTCFPRAQLPHPGPLGAVFSADGGQGTRRRSRSQVVAGGTRAPAVRPGKQLTPAPGLGAQGPAQCRLRRP